MERHHAIVISRSLTNDYPHMHPPSQPVSSPYTSLNSDCPFHPWSRNLCISNPDTTSLFSVTQLYKSSMFRVPNHLEEKGMQPQEEFMMPERPERNLDYPNEKEHARLVTIWVRCHEFVQYIETSILQWHWGALRNKRRQSPRNKTGSIEYMTFEGINCSLHDCPPCVGGIYHS